MLDRNALQLENVDKTEASRKYNVLMRLESPQTKNLQ